MKLVVGQRDGSNRETNALSGNALVGILAIYKVESLISCCGVTVALFRICLIDGMNFRQATI